MLNYVKLYTPTFLPMMPRPGTQALVVSRADKIAISALFASSLVRNIIFCYYHPKISSGQELHFESQPTLKSLIVSILHLLQYCMTLNPGGGGTPYNGLYGEAPPERDTFFRLRV